MSVMLRTLDSRSSKFIFMKPASGIEFEFVIIGYNGNAIFHEASIKFSCRWRTHTTPVCRGTTYSGRRIAGDRSPWTCETCPTSSLIPYFMWFPSFDPLSFHAINAPLYPFDLFYHRTRTTDLCLLDSDSLLVPDTFNTFHSPELSFVFSIILWASYTASISRYSIRNVKKIQIEIVLFTKIKMPVTR